MHGKDFTRISEKGREMTMNTKNTNNRKKITDILLSVAAPVVIVVLWAFAASGGLVRTAILPAPKTVASTLWSLSESGKLWHKYPAGFARICLRCDWRDADRQLYGVFQDNKPDTRYDGKYSPADSYAGLDSDFDSVAGNR